MRRLSVTPMLLLLAVAFTAACDRDGPVAPARMAPLPGAAAGVVAASDGTGHRPFLGRFAGASQFVGPCAQPGAMLVQDRGDGVVTHLGISTLEMSGCIVMTATGFTSVGAGGGQMVAANGDALHFTGVSASGDLLTGIAHATFVIQGGSGRFQGAAGEFDVVTTLLPGGAWTSSVSGWISY